MMKKRVLSFVFAVLLAAACSTAWAFPAVQVYQKSSGSVVLIVASAGGGGSMLGTGSIISDNGLVITNAHVVVDSATGRPFPKVKVYIKPDEVTGDIRRDLTNPHEATVSAYNSELDLAVLKVSGLKPSDGRIALANPTEIMVGEEVVAIGHPEQGGLWTLTYGRISGQIANQSNIKGKDVFQTDTDLNRGNSGGPLLDRRGYMVGVNTNIARKGSGDIAITGVNFALKASVVSLWLASQGMPISYGSEPLYAEQEAVPPVAAPAPRREEPKLASAEPAPPSESRQQPAYAPEPEQRQQAAADDSGQRLKNKNKRDRKIRKNDSAQQSAADSTSPAAPVPEAKSEPKPAPKSPSEQSPKDWLGGDKELKSGDMLTPKRPYSEEDLFKQTEIELEDMMNDMKMKFK